MEEQRRIVAGSTSVMLEFPVVDSSSAFGGYLAGLLYNSSSLTAYYNRQGAAGAATAISLVTMTKGTWVDSGFVAVDGTNMPGVYQLGLPDAALAAGAKYVTVVLKGATNMKPAIVEIELTSEADYAVNLTQIDGVANNPALAQLGVHVVTQDNIDFGALQKLSLNAATPASVQNIVAQTADAGGIPAATDIVLSASHGAGPWDTSSAVNVTSIGGSTTAADKLGLSADSMKTGTIDTGSLSPTNALFEASDITDAATNYWVNRWVVFTTGALAGQAKPISGYQLVAGKGRFTTDAFTSAPSNADTFIIV